MKIYLYALVFNDFRNIKNRAVLTLGQITTLVGANEAGKSNILRAIKGLSDPLSTQDTKINTARRTNNKPPSIDYYLKVIDPEIQKVISERISNYKEGDLVLLRREGDHSQIGISDGKFRIRKIVWKSVWKNVTENAINQSGITLNPGETIIGNKANSLKIASLVKKGMLAKTGESENISHLKDIVTNALPVVEAWVYESKEHENKYYVPNEVPWQEFIDNPDTNLPCKNLFIMAGKENSELSDFQTKIKNLSGQDTEIQNFLDGVAKTINSIIDKTWSQSSLEIHLTYQTDKLRIDTKEGGVRKPPDVRSEGVKWFLSFLIDFQSRGQLEEKIVIFDQPGERLHPGGQKELRHQFENLSSTNQVVYSTQSPFLVDRNEWNRVRFLKKDQSSSTQILIPSIEHVRNDELLRNSLGYTLADVGQANDFNIVAEGFSDAYILKQWSNCINNRNIGLGKKPVVDLNYVAIFDAHGRGSIRKAVTALCESQLYAIGLYDGDKAGESALKEAKRNRALKDHLYSLSELANEKDVHTAEDLVPREIFIKSLQKYFSKEAMKDHNVTCPRMANLEDWYRKNNNENFSREKKDELWEIIYNCCENDEDDLFIKSEELQAAEKVLIACNEKFKQISRD